MPFNFLLEYLKSNDLFVRQMFQNYAVFIDDKIYLNVRNNAENPLDSGIWIGTVTRYHKSLIKQFPALTNINTYNIKRWLYLPSNSKDFKDTAIGICKLIMSGDPRIGVAPLKRVEIDSTKETMRELM